MDTAKNGERVKEQRDTLRWRKEGRQEREVGKKKRR